MAKITSPVLRQLRKVALGALGGGLSDGQLLRTFLSDRDECAFEALVRRHGPMVMGVCRRVLGNAHDAEDAFQAAFLVLVRKATTLARREIVGDWLHGVAYRTALKARTLQARRRRKERRVARPEAAQTADTPDWYRLLDQELQGLPEKYRVPIILCELEGRSHQEAARQIGCPVGTLSGRLSRARALLARRLKGRGLTPASRLAPAVISPALVGSTVKAATLVAAGQAAAGIVSAQVAAITEGVVRAMLLNKLKTIGVVILLVAFLGIGTGAIRSRAAAEEKETAPKAATGPSAQPVLAPPAAESGRRFEIVFVVKKIREAQTKIIGSPRLVVMEGKPASLLLEESTHAIKLGEKVIFLTGGLLTRTIVSTDEKGNLALDMTVSRDQFTVRPSKRGAVVRSESARLVEEIELGKSITLELRATNTNADTIAVTATVSEETHEKTIDSAEKDLKTAEFYRRTGKRDSALFYYRLILRRYPDTLYADQAKKMIEELSAKEIRPPLSKDNAMRVGEIRIINNTQTKDDVILEHLGLYPGQAFSKADLRKAEERLYKHVLFANPGKISVTSQETGGAFQNILVTVKE
jgi:RNA polymerase sigma factor (sigma-70 family)